MFEKLTYSGPESNSYIYFSLDGDVFDIEQVTKVLGIKPTSFKEKQNPIPKFTSWEYRIEIGSNINITEYLEGLINLLEPKIENINKIKKVHSLSSRLQFVIDIDIDPNTSTPHFSLNKRSLEFLCRTKTIVDYDLYKCDTLGLLKE